ncbi:MAG: Ig-like domain-containing protein, partial [Candidatus Omnitrophica bacterium]|nr:Ig-like domain-containing protein [Candidatus Omnitrophota bacterium]
MDTLTFDIIDRASPCMIDQFGFSGGFGTGIYEFSVQTSPGFVEWDIPGGRELPPDQGFDYAAIFCEPGQYTAMVKLTPEGDEPPCFKEFEFEIPEEGICDVELLANTSPFPFVYSFEAAGLGGRPEVYDIRWNIRGPNGEEPVPPRPPEFDPFKNVFEVFLCTPGTWTVEATARALNCDRECVFPSMQVEVPDPGSLCDASNILAQQFPGTNMWGFSLEVAQPPGEVFWELKDAFGLPVNFAQLPNQDESWTATLDPAFGDQFVVTATLITQGCMERCSTSLLVDISTGKTTLQSAEETSVTPSAVTGGPIPKVGIPGLFYYAIIDVDTGGIVRRGITGDRGIAHTNLILGPDTNYEEYIIRAETLEIGFASYKTPGSGRQFTVPDFELYEDTSPDFDNDGLSAIGEYIVGSLNDNPDSDEDGILDGDEVRMGLNPVDGFPVRTGILSTADTPGTAVDVCSVNDIAIIADSGGGVSVFNIFNGMDPTIVAQVDTPRDARRIACSGNIIAVADCEGGLIGIDITDPPDAEILYQKDFSGSCAQALVVAGDVAYVGFGDSFLVAVDLPTGEILDFASLDAPVADLFIEQDNLYALTETTFYVLEYQAGVLEEVTTRNSPTPGQNIRNLRLFVGEGIAYAIHAGGYNTFDVADPNNPSLIQAGTSMQVGGWQDMSLNGSGLGIAAVGAGSNTGDVGVYDVSSATETNDILFGFSTPGAAKSVSIFEGLAYVADGGNGIQVVNYLSADLLENPPEITLAANFPLDPTAEVQAGSLARITADVTDDIQVSHVEFYIGGELAASDGDFPFEHRFIAPLFDTQFFFTLQAKVVDTGGNETWTDEITVNLLEDTRRPRITRVQPLGGNSLVDTVLVRFNEPMDPETFNSVRFFVRRVDDGAGLPLKGIGDIIPDGVFSYRENSNTAILQYPIPLSKGRYEIVVINSVADLSGNRLRNTFHSEFFVGDAVFWTRPGESNWNVGGNWSSLRVPSASDTVIASLAEEATIVIDTRDNVIAQLYTDHRIEMTAFQSELTVNGPFQLNNTLEMKDGALSNAVITTGTGGRIDFIRGGPDLNALTINGDLNFVENGTNAIVRDNLTINGRI